MDELIGKGFGVILILKMLAYMSTTMVPLALPLAVLLASIMTFGNLGENYELIAIKSSGVSLLRIMQPLFFVMIVISAIAFVVSNNLIPVASLKAYTLLYDLRNSKLTLSMREGQFNNEINGYSIRVGHKSKDGNTIKDVLIYDHSAGYGKDKIIIAKEGQMIATKDRRYLTFRLKEGWRYEEGINQKEGKTNHSQIRMQFRELDKVFDMSAFKIKKTDENAMKGGQAMMNISQLNSNIDTVLMNIPKEKQRFNYELKNFLSINNEDSAYLMKQIPRSSVVKYSDSWLNVVPDSIKLRVIENAESQARSVKIYSEVSNKTLEIYSTQLNNFLIEWHRKFALAVACLLMYLIGAPLGAIIRKGGIGLPLIVATIFFVAYFISSKSGESLASTKDIQPILGMWLSTIFLLPFAFFFIRAARNDSKMFSKEWYIRIVNFIKNIFKKNKNASAHS